MRYILFLFAIGSLVSCSHKNTEAETAQYADQFSQDPFPNTGTYVWAFNLMGGEQVSTHTFYPDRIEYTMTGKVYSTDYTMRMLSYEAANQKWIGEDEQGFIYVLFFQDWTDSTGMLYKRKCKTNGLAEALAFSVPPLNATDDHGWNTYAINQDQTRDKLPISGTYAGLGVELFVADTTLSFGQKVARKMSFHRGERRWVGRHKNEYVQVFFRSLEEADTLQIATQWSNDLEALYNTKYHTVTKWDTYIKQYEQKNNGIQNEEDYLSGTSDR